MEFVKSIGKLSSSSKVLVKKLSQPELDGWGLCGVKLRPYQLDGLSWLVQRHSDGHGCILGDEMGLGKTLQVRNHVMVSSASQTSTNFIRFQSISFLVYLHGARKISGPFLVLAPLSVIKNWELEFSRYT